MKQSKIWKKFLDLSIRSKLTILFFIVAVNVLCINIYVCLKVNNVIDEINRVYSSNVDTNKLSENLEQLGNYVYEYLGTRSSKTLENYYRSEEQYNEDIKLLNRVVTDNELLNLERHIRNMSENYLTLTEDTIAEKRGGNIQKYKTYYEESVELKAYISDNIQRLNNLHFKQNSLQYTILMKELQRIELVSLLVIIISMGICLFFVYMLTGNVIKPLIRLAESADKAVEGNFLIQITMPKGRDEIYRVTEAFNSMMISIRSYITQIMANMEKEKQMQERELLIKTHLKDAQLKYLQAQINPHFLFNSLNAGAQLAAMEDAEKTCVFIERMAEFFRYNVKKMEDVTTLKEEIATVDNYIYIMNVRFAGEIAYDKSIDQGYLNVTVPSMILQPLVENALNYGIRDINYQGKVSLLVEERGEYLAISISDNGVGMSKERINQVLCGRAKETKITQENSSGIGLDNVQKRLELFYHQEHLLTIESKNIPKEGTCVTINIPKSNKEEADVSNFTCG